MRCLDGRVLPIEPVVPIVDDSAYFWIFFEECFFLFGTFPDFSALAYAFRIFLRIVFAFTEGTRTPLESIVFVTFMCPALLFIFTGAGVFFVVCSTCIPVLLTVEAVPPLSFSLLSLLSLSLALSLLCVFPVCFDATFFSFFEAAGVAAAPLALPVFSLLAWVSAGFNISCAHADAVVLKLRSFNVDALYTSGIISARTVWKISAAILS